MKMGFNGQHVVILMGPPGNSGFLGVQSLWMEELEPCIINNARGQTAAAQWKWVSMGNTWVLDNLLTTYNGFVGDYGEINHGPLCRWLDRGHRSVFPRTPRNTGVYTRHPTFVTAMSGVLTRLPAKLSKNGMRVYTLSDRRVQFPAWLSRRLCPWARHLTIIASSFGWDVRP